ncbi:hypothetical protein CDD81_119 [Ophiocordyceps australis]|uniref:AMP-dependent synthetase/ligase domain-containing protein n=1 Tax=Ophiocordyceps australis TaxID=1399860 RepID=A0A2C5YIA0_9HYPO|nr:hypothetical protein CDD81_119 [Ophiocordyceps australis]
MTMIYQSEAQFAIPNMDLLTLLFDSEHTRAQEHTRLHAEAHDPDHGLTMAQTRAASQQIAYFLRHQYGIGASGSGKDVVVTVSTGQHALPCLFYGIIAARGIFSSASPAGIATELARQIKDGPAKVVVCSRDLEPTVAAAAKLAAVPDQNVLVFESYPQLQLRSINGSVVCGFDAALPWDPITDAHELKTRTIAILYSSGTTGLPKGVAMTHANLVAEAYSHMQMSRPTQSKGFVPRSLAHLPTAHIAGTVLYFVRFTLDGGIVYWMQSYNFDAFIRHVAELKINALFTVPPIWTAVTKFPVLKNSFKQVEVAWGGAAPFSTEVQQAASDMIAPGFIVSQVWGMTETCGAVTGTPPRRLDTIGSLSPLVPNVAMRLVDDDGLDVAPGEAGEALLKGPTITNGYHNNPEANKASFTPDGWFCTGDILRVDKDLVYLVDRKKELIKYKGMQVAPAELEGLIVAHPAVADVAVIGLSRQDTEVPRAYVVLAPEAKGSVSEADIIDYVKARVAAYKQLRGGVVFVDSVPRSPSGKILRKQMRDAQKKMEQQSRL